MKPMRATNNGVVAKSQVGHEYIHSLVGECRDCVFFFVVFVLRLYIFLFAHGGCVNVVFQNFAELSPMDKSYLEMIRSIFWETEALQRFNRNTGWMILF